MMYRSSHRAHSTAYYKRKRRSKRVRTIKILLLVFVILLALTAIAFALVEFFPVYSSARMEAGTKADIKEFLRFPGLQAEFAPESEKYDPNVPGTYELQIKAGLFTHPCTLTIEDTTPPELTTKDLILGREDTCEAADFVESVSDVTDTTVEFAVAPDPAVKGTEQEIVIKATDTSGNTTEKTAHVTILPITYRLKLEVGSEPPSIYDFIPETEWVDEENNYIISDIYGIDYLATGEYDINVMYEGIVYPAKICLIDTQPPVFTMAENFTSFLGESIRYKSHVSVTDNSGFYDLKVDTSKVDPNTLGSYEVTYTATDAAGNSASVVITLTIAQKTVNEEELYSWVDSILSEILWDGMSQEEKAEAIFNYVGSHFVFVDFSDKSDFALAALNMLQTGQGDCYSFFAISKALLDRAGVKNKMIYTHPEVHEHYWNLVDIEDGHGWYHFDTTPSIYPVRVFLWTDEDIRNNDDGRYSYDRTEYPNIP